MPRYDDLISSLGKQTILCSNLGFGEQGAVLTHLPKSVFVCPDIEEARNMSAQLKSLNKECIVIDEFDKPFTLSKFQSHENKFDLIRALFSFVTKNSIIISTPKIFFLNLPNLDEFKNNILEFEKGKDYEISLIEKQLVNIGYKKVDVVTYPGEFAKRGDILDVFTPIFNNPIRLDFFDTLLEDIYSFDYLSSEKTEILNSVKISPNKLFFFNNETIEKITNELKTLGKDDPTFFDIASNLENNDYVPLEFLNQFTNSTTFLDLNTPIILSKCLQIENLFNSYLNEINLRINSIFKEEKIKNLYLKSNFLLNFNEILAKIKNNLIIFENFEILKENINSSIEFEKCLKLNFKTHKFSNFLYDLNKLYNETKNLDKQIYLCLNSIDTFNSIKKIFTELNFNFSTNKNSKGLILTELKIPYNICFEDEDKYYIGSTNFAHKKEFKKESKTQQKYLPRAGEYVVHSTHGIGKCEGTVTILSGGVEKEFFKLIYHGGDILYVPSEHADCLSLYLTNGVSVKLNKLGGKEFTAQKLKAVQSIEDMSKELLELYAKRKAVKGYKYSEDDYLFTEFENAFEHTETSDQLQAISDIKNDMHSGKVMDRLICGDVGFGKTEVAMRAMFKAVENGKQVAIMAPTTILSLQHFMTASSRTKDFGVKVEMLNRFKSSKEQKAILEELSEGKINVICGTHRLLSKDVKFKDLGLLILDEEQRFGVKAKEQIKQLKNNVNVLTLSATPIPRTLSMTLMNIRDISIINTPPVDRLPVKTYVMGYNEDIILNAINDEINRDGQVLIVYNNVEMLPKVANSLSSKLNNPKAKFDIAHGQMSEIALENAIKRLYDRETNVFVSTTLIENGIDLPKANTLIVIDSDHLGLSQMYQLRGRVGRNKDQAYAYFTYNKEKILTEESTSRLQAIAEHTELGSGFKIAMRDLQIRGAGELLGKVQHGHMIKIGYDMYSKLLRDTLKRLKGEKVEIERDIKLDIAISSTIPRYFLEDETERLKIIAKITNIVDKTQARNVLNELMVEYGKLPREIHNLINLSLIKTLATKQKVKNVTLTKTRMAITFYDDIDINQLVKKVNKFARFRFEKSSVPTITLDTSMFSVETAISYTIEFLNG
ncbi:MAG: transcription-repair coupling factor [Clostridiales bacterium]|nr:transcription-repair coupling factor [Clostridiales bacterium]